LGTFVASTVQPPRFQQFSRLGVKIPLAMTPLSC
jgi:hypothetical protein